MGRKKRFAEPAPEGQKRCAKCSECFPLTEDFWRRTSQTDDGWGYYCKPCWKAHDQAYYAQNRDKRIKAAICQNNKVRSENSPIKATSHEPHHTIADIDRQYERQDGKCYHCGAELNNRYHVDHLIPINRGGTNGASNIVCSCPKCNRAKGDMLVSEWKGEPYE